MAVTLAANDTQRIAPGATGTVVRVDLSPACRQLSIYASTSAFAAVALHIGFAAQTDGAAIDATKMRRKFSTDTMPDVYYFTGQTPASVYVALITNATDYVYLVSTS